MKNPLYWAYNCPLQLRTLHEDPEDANSPIKRLEILNYMPRKERTLWMDLSEELLGDQTKREFFKTAADHLRNLARQFDEAAEGKIDFIYYHDEGMEKSE